MIHVILPLFGLVLGIGVLLMTQALDGGSKSFTLVQQAINNHRINYKLQKTLKRNRNREDNLFENTRYYLSKRVFNRIRLVVSLSLLFIFAIIGEFNMAVSAAILYVLSAPKEYIFKISSLKVPLPWYFFYSRLMTIEQGKMDDELIEGMAFLKNMIVAQNNRSIGGDSMITTLSENADLTKEAYLVLLNKMRLHQIKEGEEAFAQKIGTDLAKDMAHLLVQLDTLDPSGLFEAVENRQRVYREIKITKQRKSDSLTSDLIFFPIVLTLFLIMMNFFLLAYYLPQEDMFHMVF